MFRKKTYLSCGCEYCESSNLSLVFLGIERQSGLTIYEQDISCRFIEEDYSNPIITTLHIIRTNVIIRPSGDRFPLWK